VHKKGRFVKEGCQHITLTQNLCSVIIYYDQTLPTGKKDSMMKKLRGRNLAHPGCLIGITVGMTVGIVLAGILAAVFNIALNTVLLTWLGLTLGLGVIGWIAGDRLTSKFPPLEEDMQSSSPPGPPAPLS
jgi:hypothetical protein